MTTPADGTGSGEGKGSEAPPGTTSPAAVTLGNPNPGGTGDAKSPPKSGSEGGNANPANDPFAALAPENRELITKKGWKNLDDGFKAYTELEKAFSTRTAQQPAKPAAPTDYTFNRPDNLPPGVTYNEEFANAFRQGAFAAGLDKESAGKVHDWYVAHASQLNAAQVAETTRQVATAADDLVKAWGQPGTPMFARNLELVQRTMEQLDIEKDLQAVGAIQTVNGKLTVVNSNIIKALAKVGASLFAEDNVFGSLNGGVNPFAKDTENLAMQGRYMNEDPDKAEQLIRMAGKHAMDIYDPWLRQRAQKGKR